MAVDRNTYQLVPSDAAEAFIHPNILRLKDTCTAAATLHPSSAACPCNAAMFLKTSLHFTYPCSAQAPL